MADIKFHCPECEQRLAVDEGAAGVTIECPRCRSSLVIPPSNAAPVRILNRQKLAAVSGTASNAYEELERKQRELSQALEEAARLRTETERSKSELARVRQDLALAVNRAATPAPAPEVDRLHRENEQLRTKLGEADAARQLLGERVAALTTPPAEPPGGESAEATEARKQIDDLQRELARVTESLSAITTERDRLTAKAHEDAEARKELEGVRAELVITQTQISELAASERALRRERDTLREQLDHATGIDSQLTETRTMVEHREAEIGHFRSTLENVTGERDLAHEKIAEQAAALEELAQVNSSAREHANYLAAQLAAVTGELQTRASAHEESLRSISDRDDSLRSASLTVDAARNEIERLKEEAATAAYEHSQLRGQLDEVAEEAKDLQHRVDSLLDDLHAREREVVETREDFVQATAARDGLEQKLAEKEAELREFSGRLEGTHRYAESKLLETQQDAEAKVESAQRDAEARVANAQAVADQLLAAKQELEGRLAGIEGTVADATGRFEALRQASEAERDIAQSERENLLHRVDQLVHDLGARESELADLKKKLDADSAAQDEFERQFTARAEEVARLTAELETARRESEERRTALENAQAAAQRELEAKVGGVTGDYEAKLASLTSGHGEKLANLTQEHETRVAQVTSGYEEKLATAARDFETQADKLVMEHETKFNAARDEASQLTRVLSEDRDRLRQEIAQSNKHADVLEARVAALQADLQRSQRSMEEVREELHATRQQHKNATGESLEKEKHAAELLAQLAAAHEAEKGVRSSAVEMERSLRGRLESVEQAAEHARRTAADRDRIAEDLQRARQELAAAAEDAREARKERDAIRLSVGAMELQLEESLDQLHAGEADREALKAELEGVRAGLERAKQHVNVLQSRRDQMREEIARLKLQTGQSPDPGA